MILCVMSGDFKYIRNEYFWTIKDHIFIASDISTVKDKPNDTHFGILSSHSEL